MRERVTPRSKVQLRSDGQNAGKLERMSMKKLFGASPSAKVLSPGISGGPKISHWEGADVLQFENASI